MRIVRPNRWRVMVADRRVIASSCVAAFGEIKDAKSRKLGCDAVNARETDSESAQVDNS